MITKVLVGYDGSPSSEDAFTFAVELASKFGAELHILGVARPPEFAEEVETRAVIEQSRRHLDKALAGARARLRTARQAHHFHVAVGHPAEQIVRYAEENAIDHIVVGHRGHTMFERWLIGSVARQVIAYAHCAVTVVRK